MDANRNVASCIGNSALGGTALFPFGPPFGLAQGGKGAQSRSNGGIFLSLGFNDFPSVFEACAYQNADVRAY
jgi:hypothetical protein